MISAFRPLLLPLQVHFTFLSSMAGRMMQVVGQNADGVIMIAMEMVWRLSLLSSAIVLSTSRSNLGAACHFVRGNFLADASSVS